MSAPFLSVLASLPSGIPLVAWCGRRAAGFFLFSVRFPCAAAAASWAAAWAGRFGGSPLVRGRLVSLPVSLPLSSWWLVVRRQSCSAGVWGWF